MGGALRFRFIFLLFLLILHSLKPHHLRAEELKELYKGARALSMGNAFVALADDEQAIFYNPAGLAGVRKLSLNYFAADLILSSDLIGSYAAGLSAFKSLSGDSLNVIIGKNIFGGVQIAPCFIMPNIGVAILIDGQFALYSQNKALPQITLGYQTTNGIVVGYGISLNRGFRQRSDLRFGLGAKFLYRRGGYHLLPPMTLVSIGMSKLKEITGNFERGVGLDAGTQFVFNFNSRMKLSFGLAITDIGDTAFTGNTADPIKSNLSAGMAFEYSLKIAKVRVTYDLRHLLQQTDFRKKSHIGSEFTMPFISVYLGVNQVYPSYGLSFDAWLLKITALSYSEELGSFVHQDPAKYWIVKTSLKFDL